MDSCPTSERLRRLLAGDLPETDLEVVRAHVEICPRCQDNLEALVARDENELASHRRDEPATLSEETFLRELSQTAPPADWSNSSQVAKLIQQKPAERSAPSLDLDSGYEILCELGRGGMGVVYKARQIRANRLVALKMILAGDHARPEDLLRFRKEAEAPARLRHPHIVQIYEVGDQGGLPYFSMEYADGGTLAQRLNRTPQPLREAATLLATLADAVHYAHTQGVIHRDLKPSNILLQKVEGGKERGENQRQQMIRSDEGSPLLSTDYGLLTTDYHPKIADFGLAQFLNDPGQTRTGAVLGTPSYMAPEQARSARVGPSADIYSLGAILYETLTGRPPFLGENWSDTFRQLQHEEPVPPRRLQPSIPRDLETICLKCLEKEPGRRYRTAQELTLDLGNYLDDRPIQARTPSVIYQWGKFARRNKALVSGVIGVTAALLLGTIVSLLFAVGEAHQRGIAESNAEERETARQAALSEAYQARVLAAQAALNEHDPALAARHLAAAPEAFRGWEWHHFQTRLDESTHRLASTPELDLIRAACDRTGWRALAREPEGLSIWNAVDGRRLGLLAPGKEMAAVSSPTTRAFRWLVTSAAGPPQLVDDSGRILQTLEGAGRADLGAFDADGGLVAIAYRNRPEAISCYDTSTGKRRGAWNGNGLGRTCMSFSPDGKVVALGDAGGIVTFWDPRANREVGGFSAHSNVVRSLCYRPDGKRLITTGDDQTLRQWDLLTGKPVDVRYLGTLANAAVFSPDGRWIATAGVDRAIRIWPTDGGEMVGEWHGHTQVITQLIYSSDGSQLASIGGDGIRLWEVRDGTGPGVLRGHENYVYPVACSPDGRLIASGGWDNAIRLWDAANGAAVATLTGHTAWIADLAFTSDSRRLCSLSNDSSLRVWDVATGRVLKTLGHVSLGSPALVYKFAIHPNGTLLAAGDGNAVRFWDLTTGQELEKLILSNTVRIVAFSPDGRWLAAVREDDANGDSFVTLYDFPTRRAHPDLRGHHSLIETVAFSPDSSSIVTAGIDRTVRLWSVATGELVRQMDGHFNEVFAAAFSPDGARLATGGRDRIIRLWNPATGEQVAQLRGHTHYIYSLAFTPDGSKLVSGSGDTTVRMWSTVLIGERRKDK